MILLLLMHQTASLDRTAAKRDHAGTSASGGTRGRRFGTAGNSFEMRATRVTRARGGRRGCDRPRVRHRQGEREGVIERDR
jgi:hypothetical protein